MFEPFPLHHAKERLSSASGYPVLNQTPKDASPIHAVITWVDGADPDHRRKRAHYQERSDDPLHENAINPHRWGESDEIYFCLNAIHNHAPWINRIWIVVAETGPNFEKIHATLAAKIRIVRHKDIFAGYETALPTFNSIAIESLLWRINGLSERFIYFNDDVFLTAPVLPSDMFESQTPILRGKWVDRSKMTLTSRHAEDPAYLAHYFQINAAKLLGFPQNRLFSTAHVAHPMRKSVLADLFAKFPHEFSKNVRFRFRDISQFLPQGLHNHACIARNQAEYATHKDYIHVKSGKGNKLSDAKLQSYLDGLDDPSIKQVCINDLPQLEKRWPKIRDWVSKAVLG